MKFLLSKKEKDSRTDDQESMYIYIEDMKGARVLQHRMWSSPLLIMCPRIIYLFWFEFDEKEILTKSDDFTYLGKKCNNNASPQPRY